MFAYSSSCSCSLNKPGISSMTAMTALSLLLSLEMLIYGLYGKHALGEGGKSEAPISLKVS
jgi:hypothetical protein